MNKQTNKETNLRGSCMCARTFYEVIKKAGQQTSGASAHRPSYMPIASAHSFRKLWCFQSFEKPLLILHYVFVAFSSS